MGERPAPIPGVDLLFTDEDAVEILEWLEDEQLRCSGCGHPRVESMDPMNEYAYRVTVLACHACGAKSKAMKKLDDLDGVYAIAEGPN